VTAGDGAGGAPIAPDPKNQAIEELAHVARALLSDRKDLPGVVRVALENKIDYYAAFGTY